MSPRRGVSPHGSQHPPLDTTPSMSDRLFRLGLAESQVDSSLDGNIKIGGLEIGLKLFVSSLCFRFLEEATSTSQVTFGINVFIF